MSQEAISKLEVRKSEVEKCIADKTKELSDASRKVSEIQVNLLEMKGELKAVIRMLEELKKDNK